MPATSIQTAGPTLNPLDLLEEIVSDNEWPFDRASDDRMVVEVEGRWADYRLFFMWQPELSAMQFSCQVDVAAPEDRMPQMYELLARVNERLWLGHFDVDFEERTPVFRQTTLLRGARAASAEQLEDLVDIAVAECERYYPAFHFVIAGEKNAEQAIESAILDTIGEA